jgi:hypothetical protein
VLQKLVKGTGKCISAVPPIIQTGISPNRRKIRNEH